MHVLRGVCRNRVEGRVPELRREFFGAAYPARSHAGEASGIGEAGCQRWRVFEVGVLTIPISHHGRA
jgi:hypothetical protein